MARKTVWVGGASAGSNNGTSYANRYDFATLASAGEPGGSTFIFCDFFAPLARTSGSGAAWTVPSGTAKQPTIIRGDDATTPCTGFWGGFSINNTWSDEGSGAWSVSTGGWVLQDAWCFRAVSASGETVLTEKANLTEVQATTDSYWFDSGATTLYAHVSGGGSPQSTLVIGSSQGNKFILDSGVSHVMVHKMPLFPTDKIMESDAGAASNNVRFSRCKVWYSGQDIFHFTYQVDNMHLWRCDLAYGNNAVYFVAEDITDSDPTLMATNCSVKRCTITDMGSDPVRFTSGDRVAVAIQYGDGIAIEENVVTSCLHGLEIWANSAYDTLPMRNITCRRNHVSDAHDNTALSEPGGLFLTCPAGWDGDGSGNVMEYNVVDGRAGAVHSVEMIRCLSANLKYQTNVIGNLTIGGEESLRCDRSISPGANIYARNNRFIDPTVYFIDFPQPTNTYDGDDNVFIDGNGLDATVSFRWANTNTDWNTVTTGWKTVAAEGAGSTFT